MQRSRGEECTRRLPRTVEAKAQETGEERGVPRPGFSVQGSGLVWGLGFEAQGSGSVQVVHGSVICSSPLSDASARAARCARVGVFTMIIEALLASALWRAYERQATSGCPFALAVSGVLVRSRWSSAQVSSVLAETERSGRTCGGLVHKAPRSSWVWQTILKLTLWPPFPTPLCKQARSHLIGEVKSPVTELQDGRMLTDWGAGASVAGWGGLAAEDAR